MLGCFEQVALLCIHASAGMKVSLHVRSEVKKL